MGYGSPSWNDEATPPGIDFTARSNSALDFGVRSSSAASSREAIASAFAVIWSFDMGLSDPFGGDVAPFSVVGRTETRADSQHLDQNAARSCATHPIDGGIQSSGGSARASRI